MLQENKIKRCNNPPAECEHTDAYSHAITVQRKRTGKKNKLAKTLCDHLGAGSSKRCLLYSSVETWKVEAALYSVAVTGRHIHTWN